MDWRKRMNAVLDYIEDNLDRDIEDRKIAMLFASSQGMFQKFFAMMTEMPLSEYIRKRRLTRAAQDIINTDEKIINIAVKYQYDSAKAFSFAFKQFHGITPSDARKPGADVQIFHRFTFTLTLSITGGSNMNSINVPITTREEIHRYKGSNTDMFLSRADKCLDKYVNMWKLSNISFMPTDRENLMFSCESGLYGKCVIKLCIYDTANKINVLRAYDGKGYCKLWAYDLPDNVLLLEQVNPGTQLEDAVPDYRERARIVAETVKGLHIPYDNEGYPAYMQEGYPTYLSWMEDIHRILTEIGGMEEVLSYLNKAMDVYAGLKKHYRQSCLLHGNLHYENLLLNEKGGFTIIDPKGVVDDPIMETARHMLNETPDVTLEATQHDADKIREIAVIIGSILCYPPGDLLKTMFIDCVLSNSWYMDEFYYFPNREGLEEKKCDVLKACRFAYDLL